MVIWMYDGCQSSLSSTTAQTAVSHWRRLRCGSSWESFTVRGRESVFVWSKNTSLFWVHSTFWKTGLYIWGQAELIFQNSFSAESKSETRQTIWRSEAFRLSMKEPALICVYCWLVFTTSPLSGVHRWHIDALATGHVSSVGLCWYLRSNM